MPQWWDDYDVPHVVVVNFVDCRMFHNLPVWMVHDLVHGPNYCIYHFEHPTIDDYYIVTIGLVVAAGWTTRRGETNHH